jgi:hypothetical protein
MGVVLEYPILAHADVGNPDCCGCISPVNRGEEADIACNEFGAIVGTVLSADHCGAVNLLPGFSRMLAFTCHECGKGNACQESPRGR